MLPDVAAVFAADDSERHRAIQPEGISDREHHLSDFDVIAVAPFGGDEVVAGNLDHGEIEPPVGVDHLGVLVGCAVAERDRDVGRSIDDMVVGDDVAAGIDDHAGGLSLHFFVRLETAEDVVDAPHLRLPRVDVHDAGLGFLGDEHEGLAERAEFLTQVAAERFVDRLHLAAHLRVLDVLHVCRKEIQSQQRQQHADEDRQARAKMQTWDVPARVARG